MNYIIAAGLVQVLLCTAFLFINKKKDTSNYLLIILLTCIGWHLATKFYIFTTVSNPAVAFRMHTFIQLAYGPLLYMYARKKNDLNFLPARLWYLFVPLIVVMTLYTCTTIAIYQYPAYSNTILKLYNTVVFLPIVLSHLIFSYLLPRAATNPNEYSLITALKIVLGLIGLTEIALLIGGNVSQAINPYIRSVLYLLLSAVPVLIIRYKYISSAGLSAEFPAAAEDVPEVETIDIIAERRLLLETDRHSHIFSKLEEVLKSKRLYNDDDLTLEKLSAATGINRHHISETLNVFAQKSFYQYINEYRIKEVLHRLDAPNQKSVSLLAIAYDCGFKTKASFNQYFKKIVGLTPSGYLKNKKAAEAA